jgi:8-oxo-dGTP pyrophosphatase MutT (NUDIX family)
MRWTVHGERAIYESPWMSLFLADVEVPDGPRFEHHLLRVPRPAAAVVVADPERGALLLWRHRFITDRWGWEVPAGAVEPGETPLEAGTRETLEETGWRPGPVRQLLAYNPTPGGTDHTVYVLAAAGAEHVGDGSVATSHAGVTPVYRVVTGRRDDCPRETPRFSQAEPPDV